MKHLLSNKAELERTFHLGEEKPWGHLDSYKPDVTLRESGHLSFFEVEYYYDQDKIISDIVCAALLGAQRLVLIFGNKKTDWGEGEKRAQATEYLAQSILQIMAKPLTVKALFLPDIDELEEKLKQAEIL